MKDIQGFYDVFLFDTEGDCIYTVFKEQDFTTNLLNGPCSSSGLGDVFRRALAEPTGAPVFVDFEHYAPSNGDPAAFMAIRIMGDDGKVIGVIAYQMPIDQLDAIVGERAGLGKTGMVTLFGADMLQRNNAVAADGPPDSREGCRKRGDATCAGRVSGVVMTRSAPTTACRPWRRTTGSTLLGANWGIVAEQDKAELLAPLYRCATAMIVITCDRCAACAWHRPVDGPQHLRPLALLVRRWTGVGRRGLRLGHTLCRPTATRSARSPATCVSFRDSLAAAAEAAKMMVFKGRAFAGRGGSAMMLVEPPPGDRRLQPGG